MKSATRLSGLICAFTSALTFLSGLRWRRTCSSGVGVAAGAWSVIEGLPDSWMTWREPRSRGRDCLRRHRLVPEGREIGDHGREGRHAGGDEERRAGRYRVAGAGREALAARADAMGEDLGEQARPKHPGEAAQTRGRAVQPPRSEE